MDVAGISGQHDDARLRELAADRLQRVHAVEVGDIALPQLPQDNVTFVGTVPQTELKQWMSRSHVMVMPSLDEGIALVQGQALACGCPVIATTNSGASDLFTDGIEGFIVPIRDPDALRDRMQRLPDRSSAS